MDSELEDYIETHIDAEPPELVELERQTNLRLVNGRMCSGHLQGRVLKMLVRMIAPKQVLELGTFSGYSALCIAEGMGCGEYKAGENDDCRGRDCFVDTVEADDELEDFIRRALASSPHGDKVRLHIGDALDWVQKFAAQGRRYDLVFIDADKRQYCEYYEACLPLVRKGGYIIADNTLWSGHVVEGEYARDKQTAGVRAFNDLVAGDARVEKVILPLRDGLTLIRKL